MVEGSLIGIDRGGAVPRIAPDGPVRVGIVGANASDSWAARAHVPALMAIGDADLTAVATRRLDTAQAAAERFGARFAFDDAGALAAHPEVDLVVVAVKVPAHAALVRTAIEAGKAVLCEWPLGLNTAEPRELAGAAERAGVYNAVGLQGRCAPEVSWARRLLDEGFVGRPTSVTAYSTLARSGDGASSTRLRYLLADANGASALTITAGHTFDVIEYLVGQVSELTATLSVQRERIRIAETDEVVIVDAPDHVLVQGRLAPGGVFSLHVHNGQRSGARTWIEVVGTEGALRLESADAGNQPGVQMQRLVLLGARGGEAALSPLSPAAMPGSAVGIPQPAANVAEQYRRLAADLRSGTQMVPGFNEAIRLHGLLDAVRAAAASGRRQWLDAGGGWLPGQENP